MMGEKGMKETSEGEKGKRRGERQGQDERSSK